MKAALGYKPMLLLDDVFDKLDNDRVEQLIILVDQHHFGQIFITDTHPKVCIYLIKSKRILKCFTSKELLKRKGNEQSLERSSKISMKAVGSKKWMKSK